MEALEEESHCEEQSLCGPQLVGAASSNGEVSKTKGGLFDLRSLIKQYGKPPSRGRNKIPRRAAQESIRKVSGTDIGYPGQSCDLATKCVVCVLVGLGVGICFGFMSGYSIGYFGMPNPFVPAPQFAPAPAQLAPASSVAPSATPAPVPSNSGPQPSPGDPAYNQKTYPPAPATPLPAPPPSPLGDPGHVESKPTTSETDNIATTATGDSTFWFVEKDSSWFSQWSQRSTFSSKGFPKVLIYTWTTEDLFLQFTYEVYGKSCYAHAHGFDMVFATDMNVDGVKKFKWAGKGSTETWYKDEKLWAWIPSIEKYLFSGKYDYVFYFGADVQINFANADFPVWAWDNGNDITVMDQDEVAYGLNLNGILFKASELSKQFLKELYAYRTDFWLQGDNGPYMETLLTFLGREIEQRNRSGYKHHCTPLCKLDKPSSYYAVHEPPMYEMKGRKHSKCFWLELKRLVGDFGQRKSNFIGFTPTFYDDDLLERHYYSELSLEPQKKHLLTPWANCFDWIRRTWPNITKNCLAFHWNGPKKLNVRTKVPDWGGCPDPSFDWFSSPWNPSNRGN